MPCQEMISEFQQVPVFSSMGAKNLLKVLPTLEQMHFAKGSKILNQGDEGDSFYVIRSGQVKVELQMKSGPNLSVARLGPKEGFGEMALQQKISPSA